MIDAISVMAKNKPREHYSRDTEGNLAEFQPSQENSRTDGQHNGNKRLRQSGVFCRQQKVL